MVVTTPQKAETHMHVTRLLSQWLSNHTVIGHRARERALVKLVQALLKGSQLSLTQLGRHRARSAYEKHHIKAADRLLANQHLHEERDGIYRNPSSYGAWESGAVSGTATGWDRKQKT
jgi:hypothetical protein